MCIHRTHSQNNLKIFQWKCWTNIIHIGHHRINVTFTHTKHKITLDFLCTVHHTETNYLPTHLLTYLLISLCFCFSHLEHRASVKRFVSLQFLNLRQSVGLLGWGISPKQGRYLHRTTHRINADKHPCLERDSNPRSQSYSERRYFHALGGPVGQHRNWKITKLTSKQGL
jgi:hypothetical protein